MNRTNIAATLLLCSLLLAQAALGRQDHSGTGSAANTHYAMASDVVKMPRFSRPVWIPAGDNPFAIAAADLNGDGHQDLAAVNWTGATMSVMFGDGTGRFGRRIAYRTGNRPVGLAVTDLNGDTRLDLATARAYASESISVFINRGSGRFERTGAYAAGRGAYAVAAGDVNRDGIVDLVSAHANSEYFAVLLGRRAGRFRVAHRYRGGYAYDIAVGDLNRDHNLDVVLADADHNAVNVRLGRGDGTFAPAHVYKSGSMPFGVVVADLDHDRKLDITAVNYGSRSVSVLLGAGDGTFGPRTRYPMGSGYVDTVLVADYDRDGDLDIATPGNRPSVRRGLGDGTFGRWHALSTSAYTQGGAVGDFNGDRRPDLAFSEACDEDEIDCDRFPAQSIAVMSNVTE